MTLPCRRAFLKVPCALIAKSSPPQQLQIGHTATQEFTTAMGGLEVASYISFSAERCKVRSGYVCAPLPSYILFYSCECLSVPSEHEEAHLRMIDE